LSLSLLGFPRNLRIAATVSAALAHFKGRLWGPARTPWGFEGKRLTYH